MSEEAILYALQTIQETNNKAHEDLREFIRGGIKGIHLEMAANAELTNEIIKELSDRQAKQNGNVAKLQKESNDRAEVVADFRRLEQKLLDYKKKWMYVVGGAVLFVLVIVVVYDMIGVSGIIELVKGVR